MKIRALIIEDEPLSVVRLKELLKAFDKIELVGEEGDGNKAITKIESLKPDLLFLDIQMPGANGFEVLRKISYSPMVIFVTAYDEYAIKAFEKNAVDYLLKPVSRERLAEAVNRVVNMNWRMDASFLEKLREALDKKNYIKRFTVSRGEEILILPEESIFFIKAEDKYTFLYTFKKRYIFSMTLKELEQKLDPEKFCRIHKSYIVALDKTVKLKKWFRRDLLVQLSDSENSTLKISRHYREEFLKRINF